MTNTGRLADQVYAALLRWDRLTINDIADKFDTSRTQAGEVLMLLAEREDVHVRGAGIARD